MEVIIENPALEKKWISPEQAPFDKLVLKQYLIVPTRSRFYEKIGKFTIGVILVKGPMEIMEIRAFSKRWYEKTTACLYFIFSRFQAIFYLDLHFFSISSTREKKAMQRFVLCYHQFFCHISYFRWL